ncbi:protein phosphatase 2C domain-containing protein [Streptomyces sp. NPDC014344]|uniref:PP2C family protein-serine/threonine phosphatase n=1 Tax=Streptomyces sp. NPDC014344 TaxID=3364871 RepID=UPI0036F94A6C
MNGAVPPQSARPVPPPPPAPPTWPAPTPGTVPPSPRPPEVRGPAPGGGAPTADAPAYRGPSGPHAAPGAPTPGASPAAPGPHAAPPGTSTPGTPTADAAANPAAAGPYAPTAGPYPAGTGPHAAPAGAPTAGDPAHPTAPDPHRAGTGPHAAVPGAPATGAPSPGVRLDRRAQAEAADGGASVTDGTDLAAPARQPAQQPAQPAQPDEYPLQAPDPRVAVEAPAVCVACRAGRVDDDGYCENCGHAQPRERDHMEQECGPVAAVSDRGLRHHRNEDAFAVGTTTLPDGSPVSVAVVCDGVSSATRPDEASLAASRAANASLLDALPRGTHPQQAMHDAILAASEAVDALAGEQPAEAREHAPQQNAPACTIVGAVVTAGLLVVGWVGDSRVYWVPVDRSGPAARLTEDDSWAAQMVAAGLMGEAEAYADHRAHAITGWLGADAYELEPHTAAFKPDRPGVVVVCTDGLWNYAESADEMAEVVPADAAAGPLHAARVLVGHALDGGGHDNVTVALVPFPAVPQGAGSA